MSWNDTKNTDDDITSQDWNEMVDYIEGSGAQIENNRGSDCTGSDAGTSRTITLNNTKITTDDTVLVFVNGLGLQSADYSIAHNAAASVITFVNAIWNTDYIRAVYGLR